MKISKSFFSLCCLAFFFAVNSFASHTETPLEGEPASITTQVQSYLNGMDLRSIDGEKKVLVDFILNDKEEIMILSTNNRDLDLAIKQRLNYKKLNNHGLEANKTYTFPLVFKNI